MFVTPLQLFLSDEKFIGWQHFLNEWLLSLSDEPGRGLSSMDERECMFELYKTDLPATSTKEHTINVGAFLKVMAETKDPRDKIKAED